MTFDPDGHFSLNPTATRTQHGAICWRLHRGAVQVLLVTSRGSGRWIIPKGWPILGLAPQEVALREAWEEAGVVGAADPLCIGLFHYFKIIGPDRVVPCLVSVYGVHVSRLRARFPERRERRRKWFSPLKAAARIEETDLSGLVAAFVPPGSPSVPG